MENPPMETREIRRDGGDEDFMGAQRAATELAEEVLGECVCMAWYDRAKDRESPAHASECHGSCEVPGYVEYAMNRGANLKVVVNDGAFVFCFRPLGEFADL
jgi:hypothetical protein